MLDTDGECALKFLKKHLVFRGLDTTIGNVITI
jgi:hypothetical protein